MIPPPDDFEAPREPFGQEVDPETVLYCAAETLGRAIGTTRAFYGEVDADAGTIDIVMDWTDGIPSVRGVFPMLIDSPPVQQMLRTGATVVEDIDTIEAPQVLIDVNKVNHSWAWIAVPLMRGGRPVALISVTNAKPRSFTPADVALVRDVGERTWQALVHANTSRRLRDYQAAMDARAGHERFFRALGDAIRDDRDDVTILFKVATMLAEHLGVGSVSFSEPTPDDPVVHDVYRHVARPTPQRTAHRVAMPPNSAGQARLALGLPVLCSDADAEPDPLLRVALVERGIGAVIVMPIVDGGRVAMILSVESDMARDWSEADAQLVRDLAERAWSAVCRVRAAAALAERDRNQALLIAWNDAIRDEADPDRVIAETLSRLDAAFGFVTAKISELDADGAAIETMRVARGGDLQVKAQASAIALPDPLKSDDFGDEPVLAINDIASDARVTDASRTTFRDAGVASIMVASVVEGGRLTALLTIQSDAPRRWTPGERQVLRDLADRMWAKVARTRADIALARSRQALGQSEKMASIGAVLAGISHELNNPLAVVTAQAELIAHFADGTDLADRARRVYEAGDRCARIIRTFLAMARQTPPERRPASPAEMIARATDQVAPAMASAGVTLLLNVAANLPNVLVDPDQIHQLIVNLLVNAQHAVADVSEGVRGVNVDVTRQADRVDFDIVDTGSGVPPAMRDRIFEPFFTTKPTGHGTGMGLALAQGLAELHGGTLTLEPSASGAHFRLSLPLS